MPQDMQPQGVWVLQICTDIFKFMQILTMNHADRYLAVTCFLFIVFKVYQIGYI